MAVLRGAAGWIIRQAAAMQAAGGRRWWACPSRWAALAAGAAAVRSGKACRLWALCRWGRAGAGAWSSGAALAVPVLPGAGGGRCDLLRLRGAGVVIVATATTPSACRSADPAGRASGRRVKARQKKKARAAARGALLLWPSVCTGGAICCAGCIPVHIVGGGGLLPVPVPGCWRWH